MRHRHSRLFLIVPCAAIAAWCALQLIRGQADALTIVGLVISLGAGFIQGLSYLEQIRPPRLSTPEQADRLASEIHEQWRAEAGARSLRAHVLPLSWRTTNRAVADRPAAIVGAAGIGPVSLRLDGRLEDNFDQAAGVLARDFRRLPLRRVVVLGEPGAGKTVLALMLVLGLLGNRRTGEPVPVLLAASSWDPLTTDMDTWIVESVARDYYNGRVELPRTLLDRDLILPVIDGLDEIPEGRRRAAVSAVNRAVGDSRPVVVTCRAVEFQDLIRGGAPRLHRAPVVEVVPLAAEEVITYLSAAQWPADTSWEQVFGELRANPGHPVCEALSTPLMVSIARMVYERLGGRPGELLDPVVFDSRHAVEDHLIDRVIEAAYAPRPGSAARPSRWTAGQARRWLTFLANDLHATSEREISWWRMSERLLAPWVGPVVGVVLGVGLTLATALYVLAHGRGVIDEHGAEVFTVSRAVVIGSYVGGVFAVATVVAWQATAAREPGRLSVALRGSALRLWRGVRSALVIAAIPSVPILAVFVATFSLAGTWTLANRNLILVLTGSALFLALAMGAAFAGQQWLAAAPDRAAQVGPVESIKQDRLSSVVSSIVGGLLVAMLTLPLLIAGQTAGAMVFGLLTHWSGYPGRPDFGAVARSRFSDIAHDTFVNTWLLVGATALLPFVAFVLLALLSRAWPRFLVLRLIMAGSRRLPARLTAFLADAHRLDLLRQSAGAYQFRHIRLQERLAGGAPPPTGAQTSRLRNRVRAAAAVAAVVVLLAFGFAGATSEIGRSQPLAEAYGDHRTRLFLSDSRRLLATVSQSAGAVQIWDTRTGKSIAVLAHHHSTIDGVVFSTDDRIALVEYVNPAEDCLWTWTERTNRLLDCADGNSSSDGFSQPGSHLSILLGDSRGPGGGGKGVAAEVWDNLTGHELTAIRGESADIEHGLLLIQTTSGTVEVREATTGRTIRGLEHLGGSSSQIVISPDGHRLLAERDEGVQLWDVVHGRLITTLDQQETGDRGSFSPDGRLVVASSGGIRATSEDNDVLRVWDADDGHLVSTHSGLLGVGSESSAFGQGWWFDPSSRWLFAEREHGTGALKTQLLVWDSRTGSPLVSLDDTNGLTVHGNTLVAGVAAGGEFELHAWQLSPGVTESSLAVDNVPVRLTEHNVEDEIGTASGDGRLFAVMDTDQVAHVWDLRRNEVVDSFDGWPDRSRLGSLASRPPVYFDPFRPVFLEQTTTGDVRLVDISGRVLARAEAGNTPLGIDDEQLTGDPGSAEVAAFGPDGRTIALVRKGSETVEVWDIDTGRQTTLTAHVGPITAVAYGADGRTLITGGTDDVVRIWNLDAATH